jgi:hypothetical protein
VAAKTRAHRVENPTKNTLADAPSWPILSDDDLEEVAESMPLFLTVKDLGSLFRIGKSEATLMAHKLGVIRYGSHDKRLLVPRAVVLADLRRRANLS